ncbi:hypothetical protein [Microbulbifer sp. SAOS-129_SWC]|uniref:hypothetical protein n=1 Tax=Microbulbifer sp. SAOS-129_SWC TaxID=3145235 RepID=UPI003216F11E
MTALTSPAPTDVARGSAQPLDALAEVFVHLGEMANVNTNQIVIVSGRLDPELLEQSVQRAAAQIPLLHTDPVGGQLRRRGTAAHRWVAQRDYAAPCDFNDPSFRHLLMDFSSAHRLTWRARPPLQLLLVSGAGGHNSCVYLSSHHGVADARSDCLILRAIIDQYAHLSGVPGARASVGKLPFAPLPQIRPEWYRPLPRALRWLRACTSVVGDLLHRDSGLATGLGGQRWETGAGNPAVGQLDFFQSLMPRELEQRLGGAARAAGVTVNTVLCAALARLMEHSDGIGRGQLRITCAVSLRRLIEPRYDRSFRNYLVPSNIRLRRGQSCAALLRSVHGAVASARGERGIGTELGRLEALLPLLRLRPLRGLARRLLNRCQGTNACYSNPGRIAEDFTSFGSPEHTTQSYVGFGCLVPPYDFILYTPTVNGRMQLDLVYRRAAFTDIHRQFAAPYLKALWRLLAEMESSPELKLS